MKIVLFGNLYNNKPEGYENQFYAICQKIKDHCIEIHLATAFFSTLSIGLREKIEPFIHLYHTSVPQVDIAFSIGGDGTFLRTAAEIAHRNMPILGINTGRLGFLADRKSTRLNSSH